MRIAILGSTGFLGKVLLERALEAGHQVRTLVRDPDRLGDFQGRVEFFKGTVFDSGGVSETVRGTEVVLSTVGPPQKNPGDPQTYEQAMENIVAAMEREGIKRYIHTGGAVHAGGENENWTLERRALRMVLNLVFKPGLVAKHLEWEVLKRSNLDWTLVRPPRIATSPRPGTLVADAKNLASLQVNVRDLADFMLEQIESRDWVRKAPLVAAGKGKDERR
jgi:putative NADH-flavin reductase